LQNGRKTWKTATGADISRMDRHTADTSVNARQPKGEQIRGSISSARLSDRPAHDLPVAHHLERIVGDEDRGAPTRPMRSRFGYFLMTGMMVAGGTGPCAKLCPH